MDARGGDKGLKVVLGQERVHARHQSLVHKALPDLTGMLTAISLADYKDKALLLCFFDMNQRPSRRLIRQLTERTQQLKQKDLGVLAIQASKVSQDKLDQWIKENNYSFAFGMMKGDETKTQLAWGIKALPWLILTDRAHVVVAEGLSMSELDMKQE